MVWFPAIIVLTLCNAVLLIAIAVAPVVRRRSRTRQDDIHALSAQAVRAAEARFAAENSFVHRSVALHDDRALCRMLTTIDQQASRALLASLPRRDQASSELVVIATDPAASDRVAAIRLMGAHCDAQSRHALAILLNDRDPDIRREAAAAAAASARLDYPRPLDVALVDRLLNALAEENVRTVVSDVIDALAYSLDPRVPAAFLRQIPSSRGSMRERLVEAGALFAHLVRAAEHRARGARP